MGAVIEDGLKSFEIELIKETEILGKVELNGKDLLVELVLEDGLLKENIVLELGELISPYL